MPPRRATGDASIHEGHYREILARLEGLDGRMEDIHGDAREGRDAALRLTAQLEALDLPNKVAAVRTDMERGDAALRVDMVHAVGGARAEAKKDHDALDVRLAALEAFRLRIDGATGVVGWLARHSPWLITVAMTALAAIGFKGKLP